ncbi:MAG: hypothetical protein ACREE6_17750 [Limisphaerales bacterium]
MAWTIRDLSQEAAPLSENLFGQEMLDFDNRRMMFGEAAAMQWVVAKYGNP